MIPNIVNGTLLLPRFEVMRAQPKVPHRQRELARKAINGVTFVVCENHPRTRFYAYATDGHMRRSNTVTTTQKTIADVWARCVVAGLASVGESAQQKKAREREKSAQAKLQESLEAALAPYGLRRYGQDNNPSSCNPRAEYCLDTKVGLLRINSVGTGAIFTQFADTDRARCLLTDVGYSGKWNFHAAKGEDVLKLFMSNLLFRGKLLWEPSTDSSSPPEVL